MAGFRRLLQSMGISNYRACATSAMREAENGPDVVRDIRAQTGVDIEVISGREEADLIFSNFALNRMEADQDYLYVDLG